MSESLGFIISDIARLMRRDYDLRARAIGVTRAQWRTLNMLSRNEGIHQGGLAELLEVEPITLCRMIDRLEESGMVERRRDPDDRRAWRMYLTPKAIPLLDQLRGFGEDLMETALGGLDAVERAALAISLDKVRANFTTDLPENETAHG